MTKRGVVGLGLIRFHHMLIARKKSDFCKKIMCRLLTGFGLRSQQGIDRLGVRSNEFNDGFQMRRFAEEGLACVA